MNETLKRMAADLAPEIEKRLTAYIDGGCILGSAEYVALDSLLWDNKVGILRVLESAAQ